MAAPPAHSTVSYERWRYVDDSSDASDGDQASEAASVPCQAEGHKDPDQAAPSSDATPGVSAVGGGTSADFAAKAQVVVKPFQASFLALQREGGRPPAQLDEQPAPDLPAFPSVGSSPLMFAPCCMMGNCPVPSDPPELSVRFYMFWTQQCERYTGLERLSRLRRGVATYVDLMLEPTMEHWARCAAGLPCFCSLRGAMTGFRPCCILPQHQRVALAAH